MRREIINMLPNGASIISLDKFGGKKDVIKVHFDNNKQNHTIFAYKFNDEIYISVLKYINEKPEIVDTYKDFGVDLSYINVAPLLSSDDKSITAGFKLKEDSVINDKKKRKTIKVKNETSKLAVLKFQGGKLENMIKDDKLNFEKIEVFDMDTIKDGICEIAIWAHDIEKALNVRIFKFSDNALNETHDYDKNYYSRVFKYYRHLVKNNPESSVYLYYFAKAQYILDFKEEAMHSIERALFTKHPYPSKKELISFKEMLEGKDL